MHCEFCFKFYRRPILDSFYFLSEKAYDFYELFHQCNTRSNYSMEFFRPRIDEI